MVDIDEQYNSKRSAEKSTDNALCNGVVLNGSAVFSSNASKRHQNQNDFDLF